METKHRRQKKEEGGGNKAWKTGERGQGGRRLKQGKEDRRKRTGGLKQIREDRKKKRGRESWWGVETKQGRQKTEDRDAENPGYHCWKPAPAHQALNRG